MTQQKPKTTRPIRKYVVPGQGAFINAAAWRRETRYRSGRVGKYISVAIQRRYVDRETGEWKSSSNYHLAELPKLRHLLDQIVRDFEQPFVPADEIPQADMLEVQEEEETEAPRKGSAYRQGNGGVVRVMG